MNSVDGNPAHILEQSANGISAFYAVIDRIKVERVWDLMEHSVLLANNR